MTAINNVDVSLNGAWVEVTAGRFEKDSAVLTIGATNTTNKPTKVQMVHTGVQLVDYDYGCRFSSNACGNSDFGAAGTDDLRDAADSSWGKCADSRDFEFYGSATRNDRNLRKQIM